MNKMKRILVTGAAGFIGSNLIRSLLNKGNVQIVGLDNFDDFYSREQKERNMSSFISNQDFSFFEADIRNMDNLLALPEIDVIVHLAAKAGVRPSILNPVLYQEVNVAGTQNLLEFARQKEIKQFVFGSSSSVYGINEHVPWTEAEKLMLERLLAGVGAGGSARAPSIATKDICLVALEAQQQAIISLRERLLGGVDKYFIGKAQLSGKKILELETIAVQLDALPMGPPRGSVITTKPGKF